MSLLIPFRTILFFSPLVPLFINGEPKCMVHIFEILLNLVLILNNLSCLRGRLLMTSGPSWGGGQVFFDDLGRGCQELANIV